MVTAIIVAGGRGVRFQSDLAKQYLKLAGRPILSHTLTAFATCPAVDRFILVAPEGDFDYCRENVLPHVNPPAKSPAESAGAPAQAPGIRLVAGGEERQDSVYNGLIAAGEDGPDQVLIHDGVRPFVSHQLISDCLNGLKHAAGCIAAIPAVDTLKSVGEYNKLIANTLDRKFVWLAQTPQAFQYDVIRQAHEEAKREGWLCTDDASLLEWQGHPVKVVPGSPRNIKITSPADLELAEAIIQIV